MSTFAKDAAEYFLKVSNHIFQGNEIRSDSFMDINEKQEKLRQLDRERTIAHDELVRSFCQTNDFRGITNRTQLADRVAMMVFEKLNIEAYFVTEGSARDELAELLYKGDISYKQIIEVLED